MHQSRGLPVTLIIQDPMGNSVLVSDKAKKTAFVPDEPGCVRGLKGTRIFNFFVRIFFRTKKITVEKIPAQVTCTFPSHAPGFSIISPTTRVPSTSFVTASTDSGGTTYAYPIPMLNVRYISTGEIFPVSWISTGRFPGAEAGYRTGTRIWRAAGNSKVPRP